MSKNILVIKLSALGDFILALGPMHAIREHHKGDKITLLTTKTFKDIAEKSGYFDEIVITKRSGITDIGEWFRMFKFLNSGKFSRVYDLQMQDRTKIYYYMFLKTPEWSGIVPQSKISYKNPDFKTLHAFKRHKEVLKLAGIENVPIPDISWMKKDINHLLEMESVKKPYVIFIAGSSPLHLDKRWPAVRFSGLALKLIRDGYDIVLIGSKDDREIIDKIKATCSKVKDLSEKTTLYDIYSLAAESSGIVSNDTGPAHIAALANKPMVSLFCSMASKPELSSPVGNFVKGIEAENMANIPVKDVYNLFKPLSAEPYTDNITSLEKSQK